MAYEYNSSVLKRILPRLRQEEVNTGRRPNPALVRALWEGELSVEANKAYRSEEREAANAIQEEALALQRERDKNTASAARVGGLVNAATGTALIYGVGKEMGWWGAKEAAKTTAQGQVANVAVGGGQTAVAGETLTTGGVTSTTGAGTSELAAASTADSAAPVSSGLGVGEVALPMAAAVGTKLIASKLGANQEISNTLAGGVGGGLFLASALGGPAGFFVGAMAGLFGGEAADTIICSELYRQGKISLMYRRAGMLYGRMVGEEVYMGYIRAARPIVDRMQTSKVFSWVVYQIAKPIMKEMIHRVNPRKEGSILGSIFLHYGIRHCINKYDSLPLSEVHYG